MVHHPLRMLQRITVKELLRRRRSVVTRRPGKVAHGDVLPQLEGHTAEPAATGGHLADELPRVRLVTVPLDSVVISARNR